VLAGLPLCGRLGVDEHWTVAGVIGRVRGGGMTGRQTNICLLFVCVSVGQVM
jgi:hypothetical protein